MAKSRFRVEGFLANFPLFQVLDGAGIARLAQETQEINAPRGTLLFRRGDPCSGFYIVVYGQVKLSLQTQDGNERVVELVGAGASFGEASMFLNKPHVVTAETLSDSKLLQLARSAIYEMVMASPSLSQNLIALLSSKLYERTSKLETYILRSGTERVIDFLLCASRRAGTGSPGQVMLPTKKNIIASHLNLTHEHFSRILRELSAAKLIKVDGPIVRILDLQRLMEYAG